MPLDLPTLSQKNEDYDNNPTVVLEISMDDDDDDYEELK